MSSAPCAGSGITLGEEETALASVGVTPSEMIGGQSTPGRKARRWAAIFYDGYCNTCDMPVENGEEDDGDVLQP